MPDLISEIEHDIKRAQKQGQTRYANRLQSILDTDNPADTLKRAAEGSHHTDELEPFLDFIEEDEAGESGSQKQWTREEWEEAAKHPEKMTREEFAAWNAAPEEGRVKE